MYPGIRQIALSQNQTIDPIKELFPVMRMNRNLILCLLSGCILLAQLNACSSPIIIHDTPLSDAVTAEETTPIMSPDTAVTETEAVTVPAVTETDGAAAEEFVDPTVLAKEELSRLRRDDLDGKNILIAAADESAVFGDRFDGDNAGSTVLPETRIARTRLVEERYNVRVLSSVYEKEALFEEIKKASLSDLPYVADFYALPYDQIGRYFANGFLLNLRTLPFTDYTADYYDSSAMKSLSAGYGLWGAVGDYTFSPENVYAIYFNKDLNEKLALPSPYTQVNDGSWTWDALFEASRTARASLDSNGNATVWGDNLGALGLDVCEPLFIDAAALTVTTTGADRTPALSADVDQMTALAALLKNNVQNSTTSPTASAYTAELFTNGDMLFCCSTLSNTAAWADAKTPWGIVPLPKIDAAQRNYSSYVGETAVMCVPSTNGALETSGTILQALFAASSHTYPDIYIDEALKYYVRDSATVDMLELICSTTRYDFTSMFVSGLSNLRYASTYAIHSAITQNYSIKTVHNTYRAGAEQELKTTFPTNR